MIVVGTILLMILLFGGSLIVWGEDGPATVILLTPVVVMGLAGAAWVLGALFR